MWVYNMGYDDDLWLEHCTDHRRRTYQFAEYATHLCSGETIQCRAIRHGTVLSYLRDAAYFLKTKTGIDPRFELNDEKLADPIKKVTDEYQRWEKVPDRREPWTIEMQKAFDEANRAIEADDKDDTLPSAIADWCALGLSTGFRLGEWAQPNENKGDIRNPDTKKWKGIIPAMLPSDFVFYRANGKMIRNLADAVRLGIDKITRVRITWRVQKNKKNGERSTAVIDGMAGAGGGHRIEPPALLRLQAIPVGHGGGDERRVSLLNGPGQQQQLLAQTRGAADSAPPASCPACVPAALAAG